MENNYDILGKINSLKKYICLRFDEGLEKYNLTFIQGQTIRFINHNPGVKQVDIQKHFELSKSTVSGLITRLEEKHYIKRIDNSLFLTDEAMSLIDYFAKVYKDLNKTLTKGLTEEEIDNLYKCLDKLKKNIKEDN